MCAVALSSGCFIGHEHRLASAGVGALELSNHSLSGLETVLDVVQRRRLPIVGVHAPCPNLGQGLNLAAEGEQWLSCAASLESSMELAKQLDARYVVVHAFYCLPGLLPVGDLERMAALRRLFGRSLPMADYLESPDYGRFKARAIENLKSILPSLLRSYPQQRIAIENLNPRIGYGGLRLTDLAEMASALGGDVGLCIDVGHLTLSREAMAEGSEAAILASIRELIVSTHIHQNFAGRYCLDRYWDGDSPQPGLQEIDTHLPFTSRFGRVDSDEPLHISADNSAFTGLLKGTVRYLGDETGETVEGRVPLEELLREIPQTAHRVFEFDSRYAPLGDILAEYQLGARGDHPRGLW